MEITHKTHRPKHLKRHALPIVIIVTALLIMPAAVFSARIKADSALAFRGLVTRVFNPVANGTGKTATANSQSETNVMDGIEQGIPQAGRSADLDFSLR